MKKDSIAIKENGVNNLPSSTAFKVKQLDLLSKLLIMLFSISKWLSNQIITVIFGQLNDRAIALSRITYLFIWIQMIDANVGANLFAHNALNMRINSHLQNIAQLL